MRLGRKADATIVTRPVETSPLHTDPLSAAANEPTQECATETCFDQCTTSSGSTNREPYRPPVLDYPSSNE